jgi:hypothetical protein
MMPIQSFSYKCNCCPLLIVAYRLIIFSYVRVSRLLLAQSEHEKKIDVSYHNKCPINGIFFKFLRTYCYSKKSDSECHIENATQADLFTK